MKMCQKYIKVIIPFLILVVVNPTTTLPTKNRQLIPSTLKEDSRNPGNETAPSDTVLAKFGNTTIIFGHQHVLFSAPTRAPSRRISEVENLVAPSRRQREHDVVSVRIDPLSEELNPFEEYSHEVSEDEEKRRELCPGTSRGRQQLLYDTKAKKCAKVGARAHCGKNMRFQYDPYVDNSTVYGYCECDFKKSRTPLVYHPATDACYFIYQKAYCETKEWVIINSEGVPVCEKRICRKSSSRRSKLLTELIEVPINGTGPCVPLNQPSKHCSDPEETVHFHVNEVHPRCGFPRLAPAPRIISPIRQIRCAPGSYVNVVGKCQPAWEW